MQNVTCIVINVLDYYVKKKWKKQKNFTPEEEEDCK